MKKAYLKCRYFKKSNIVLWPNEYLIFFRCYDQNYCNPIHLAGKFKDLPDEEDWCIIDESDLVKKIDDERGIARIYIGSLEKEKVSIGIHDLGDHRISSFDVPRLEVLFSITNKTNI